MGFYQSVGKRACDLIAAMLILLFLAPLLLVVALLIFVVDGPPVLFRQKRPGLHGTPFLILKFRTMRNTHDLDGRTLPDEYRLTRLGRLLRSTSLDELPELINVLLGEMSLVGPRPLLMHYLKRYSPKQARRHEVRPGITGLAQIHGRNATSWEKRLELDTVYVDNCSLGLDLRILFATVIKVFTGEGISATGHATMPEFTGKWTGSENSKPRD